MDPVWEQQWCHEALLPHSAPVATCSFPTFPKQQAEDERNQPAYRPSGWDHLYLCSATLSFPWMKVLVVSTSISLRLWNKGDFCVALMPWSSGKQPYLLILLNKLPAFMLSVGRNKKNRVRRYIIACELNVLFALLCGWWWRWWNDS